MENVTSSSGHQSNVKKTADIPSSKKRLTSQTEVLEPSILLTCNTACDHSTEQPSREDMLGVGLHVHFPPNSHCDTDGQGGLMHCEAQPHLSSVSEDTSLFVSEDLPSPFRIEQRDQCFSKDSQSEGLQPRCASLTKAAEITGPPSLGQEMITLVDKLRDIQRNYNVAVQEREQLAKQNAKQSRENERLSRTVQFLGRELKSKFQQMYPDVELKRDQSHVVAKVCQGLKKEITMNGGKIHVVGQSSKGQFLNPDIINDNSEVKTSTPHFENVTGMRCSNCEKILQRENELRMDSERRLGREKQRSKLLESKLRSLQEQLHDLQNCSDRRPSENLNSQDRVVQDLLTEISVLQQQMVVVVEDFEKERNDRAKAVSSRNKLKENFQSLNEKVLVLKRQLMLAHSRLTDFVARNNALEQTVQQLQSELRVKDQKLAQAVLNTGFNAYHNDSLQVPPMYLPMQQPVRSHFATVQQQPATRDWSCPACTFFNSGHRSVCDICGAINYANRNTSPARDFPECHGTLERNCRLVSRGLSTDEGLTDLDSQGTRLPGTNANSPTSHSL